MGVLEGKHVLVSGGLGFIGSHTCVCLVQAGARVTIVDDLSNSFLEVLNRLEKLLGPQYSRITFKRMDIKCIEGLRGICSEDKVDAIVHFAAFKAVGESIQKPLEYYRNNVDSTLTIGEAMAEFGIKTLVFSSSCTVYGEPERIPIDEECSQNSTTSPYGRTKVFNETILQDMCAAAPEMNVCLLRYFNPVAAHPSGLIGEHPIGVPANLMPFVQQVAAGVRPVLKVFGNDYNTRDGTTIRDYIHVVDLAEAHVAALTRMLDTSQDEFGCRPINIGTGTGSTVLEMVAAMEKACGHKIPIEFSGRREGDTEAVWAATGLAEKVLSWKSRFTVEDMCRDQWNWARRFPRGYEETTDMMRPHTLPREMSFDVFNSDTGAAAAAARDTVADKAGTGEALPTEVATPEAAQNDAATVFTSPGTPTPVTVAVGKGKEEQEGTGKGIFREILDVNSNGIDGVPFSGQSNSRDVGGSINVTGVKPGVVPASNSPGSKPTFAVAHC